MKQIVIQQGKSVVQEVPAPKVRAGNVLVRVAYSCISIGTEMSGIKISSAPLWKRALKHPEKVRKVLQMAVSQGVSNTFKFVESKLSSGQPTGYSAAGTVLEVGDGIEAIKPGDRVACAGAQCAHHAEIICVPQNLTVAVPNEVNFTWASTVTLGSIALQGVRRAKPTLGESFVVIGLGILGQLSVQILNANGCRVIGIDLDSKRVCIAERAGMDIGLYPEHGKTVEQVMRVTGGLGADGVIITAATPSHQVVSNAFQMCRKKGRVVVVGDIGLDLDRADIYQKELDFFISTSYGPGRYDRNYEEEGLDYPPSYVRWTENRNMQEYLRLVAQDKVKLDSLLNATYPIEQAEKAYREIEHGKQKPLMVLLSYSQAKDDKIERVVFSPKAMAAKPGQIRVAVIGAGGFAKGMHLPNVRSLSQYHIRAIVDHKGHNAAAIARQYAADYSSTDYNKVLADSEVDALIICTRHDSHTSMALSALKAGKHVLLEKPLAMTQEQLTEIQDFFKQCDKSTPLLLTGFNRRFSPFAKRIRHIVAKRSNPMIIQYRMNGGHIPLDHWVHNKEGGGRNIGEACHIYDLFTYLTDSHHTQVSVQSIAPTSDYYSNRDNFITSITFEDGSLANLVYTALGTTKYPKERMEVFVDGKVLVLDNYTRLDTMGINKGFSGKITDKGHKEQLRQFAKSICEGTGTPIPLWQQFQATKISFEVENFLAKR